MKPKAKKVLTIILIVLAISVTIIGAVFLGLFLYNPPLDDGVRVLAYITSASVVNAEDLSEFDFSTVTHLIYSFAHVKESDFTIYIEEEDSLARLSEYIHEFYPNVKLMLSVGSDWNDDGFCRMSHSKEGREFFANQCSSIMRKYRLSGIDIDWEYPNFDMYGRHRCRSCPTDHATLLETLRNLLPSDALLSYAGPGSAGLACGFINDRLSKIVDFVNVMLYDFSLKKNSPVSSSAYGAWNYQLLGYSKKQINWGLPFYGRCADEGYDYYSYSQIQALILEGRATLHQNTNQSYAMFDGHRLSYDSRDIIMKKTQLINKRGYGGVFCWHFSCDNGELMSLIWNELRG